MSCHLPSVWCLLYFTSGSASFSDFDVVCGITLEFKEEDRRQCYNITIREDEICEYGSESFQVRLILTSFSDDIRVRKQYETTIIVINDVPEPECSKYNALTNMLAKLVSPIIETQIFLHFQDEEI